MSIEYDITIPPGGFVAVEERLERLAERLVLDVSDRAATRAKTSIRRDMRGANLGRLGNAIGSTSDKRKNGRVQRRGKGIRASGVVFIRSKSPRTVGAIISYTEGAAMVAKNRSGFMWYPLESAQRIVGTGKDRRRLTPGEWRSSGMEAKLGPLFRIRGSDGAPLLVVRKVGVSAVGARGGRPRSLTKTGRARKGDRIAEIVPIFKGIRSTSRTARVNPRRRAFEAAQQAAADLRGT